MDVGGILSERTGVIAVLSLVIGIQTRIIFVLWAWIVERTQADRNRITQLEQALADAAATTRNSASLAREAVSYVRDTQDKGMVHGPPA